MFCLWCDEEIIEERDWLHLFTSTSTHSLCNRCREGLVLLQGNRCLKCSRKYDEKLCFDCKRWGKKDPLNFNVSLFIYNEQMKEMVAQWKYRGDYVLGLAFKKNFIKGFLNTFHDKQNYVLVPIPLSNERLKERGFNQAEMLASFLPGRIENLLQRTKNEKQAKKTRRERLLMKNPFRLKKKVNTPVILIDDIYTTGMTLRHASYVLREGGCKEVYAYTLIRG